MSKILPSFRRLRWKLTFSYTVVTAAVVLALEAAVLLVGGYSTGPSQVMSSHQGWAADLVAVARPFLRVSPPDYAGLESELREAIERGPLAAIVSPSG